MQHPAITLVDPDGGPYNPATAIPSGTYVRVGEEPLSLLDPRVNVVLDGTTDNTASLATAVDLLSAASGGTLYHPGGVCRGVLRLKSKVKFKGSGWGSVLQRPTANTTGDVIALFSPREEQVEIEDVSIDGNKFAVGQTAGHGIYIANDSQTNGVFASGFNNPRHKITRVLIRNVKQKGLYLNGDQYGGACQVSGVQTYHCDEDGIYVVTPDSTFTDCDAGQSGWTGIRIIGAQNRLIGCKAWLSGRLDATKGDGFRLGSSITLTSCLAQDNAANGFNGFGAAGVVGSDLIADTNGSGVAAVGFNFQNAFRCQISGFAWDRGGDSGLAAAVQQYALNYLGSTQCHFHITSGREVSGPYPGVLYGTGDNVVVVTQEGSTSTLNYLPHTKKSHIDSSRTSNGATPHADTMAREVAASAVALINGRVHLSYFTSAIPLTLSKIAAATRGVAGVGATLARMGLYTVAANGDLALVARTASDTTLFAATFSFYERSIDTTGGYPATYSLSPGVRYAMAVIVVGTSTAPQFYGCGIHATVFGWDPRLSGVFSGQTDLPTSIPTTSVVNDASAVYMAASA